MAAGISKVKGKGYYRDQFTVNGKRYSVYGKSVKECRDKELEKRADIESGRNKKSRELTLDEYFENWIADKAGSVKESSIRARRLLYADISAVEIDRNGHTFGSMKLVDIEVKDVKALQTILKEGGEKAGKDRFGNARKPMKTRSVNDAISLLSTLLDSAINERIIQWNAAKAIKALRRTEPTAAETIHRNLSREELTAFLEKAREEENWYYNLFVFLLNTGTRIGEAGAVTRSDIRKDEDGNYILHIHRTVTRTETGAWKIGDDTKTAAGNRLIPLNDAALKAVRDQQQMNRVLHPEKALSFQAQAEPIFTGLNGGYLLSSRVCENIRKICQDAGIEKFTPHAFRDSFCTRCVESGMEVKQLQSLMGHTDIKMTMGLYAHSDEGRKVEQLKAVNFM